MKKLGARGQKWLKFIHLIFACMWVGGGVALVLMQFSMHSLLEADFDMELYGINRAMRFVDDLVIIPGAFGSLLTGLVYSVWTNWGFFRHRWITLKWIINVGGIIFGTFWLGPWLNSLGPIARRLGLASWQDAVYLHNLRMNSIWATLQVATLVLAVFISVFKPWKGTGKRVPRQG